MINVLINEISSLFFCYIIGSIPTGYLITKFVAGIDVRLHGSGNIGATNVSRLLGKKFFFLVMLIDALKSFGALFFVQQYSACFHLIPLCASAVLLGNCYSLFLRGEGGKGGATYFGIAAFYAWFLGVLFFVSWLVVYLVSKVAAKATLFAALLVLIAAYIFAIQPFLFFFLTCTVFVRHQQNIRTFLP